jgi:hypothetical protein
MSIVSKECVSFCGNGFMMGDEKCDDGGKGGCTSDCKDVSPGWTCVKGDINKPSVCKNPS